MKEETLLHSISHKKHKLEALTLIRKAIYKHKEKKEIEEDSSDLKNIEKIFTS